MSIIACIDWFDSSRSQEWEDTTELERRLRDPFEMRCRTIGLLVGESSDRVVITSTQGDGDQALQPLVIPRRAIIRIRKRTVAAVFGPTHKGGR